MIAPLRPTATNSPRLVDHATEVHRHAESSDLRLVVGTDHTGAGLGGPSLVRTFTAVVVYRTTALAPADKGVNATPFEVITPL